MTKMKFLINLLYIVTSECNLTCNLLQIRKSLKLNQPTNNHNLPVPIKSCKTTCNQRVYTVGIANSSSVTVPLSYYTEPRARHIRCAYSKAHHHGNSPVMLMMTSMRSWASRSRGRLSTTTPVSRSTVKCSPLME